MERDPRSTMNHLPFPAVLEIASFLCPRDLLRFSHTCKNVFETCDRDKRLWTRLFQRKKLEYYQEFLGIAASIADKQTLFKTKNVAKLALFMWCGTNRNWRNYIPAKIVKSGRSMGTDLFNNSKYCVVSYERLYTNRQILINLSVYDVRTCIDYSFSISETLQSMKLFVLDDFILQETSANGMGHLFTCYKMDKENGNLVKAWGTKFLFKDKNLVNLVVQETFVAICVTDRNEIQCGHQKDCFCRKYMITFFSIADGSFLFRYFPKGGTLECYETPEHWSTTKDDWFVFLLPPVLRAVNLKTKKTSVIKHHMTDIRAMAIHGDKLAFTFKDESVAEQDEVVVMIDLATGSQLWRSNLIPPLRPTPPPRPCQPPTGSVRYGPRRYDYQWRLVFDNSDRVCVLHRRSYHERFERQQRNIPWTAKRFCKQTKSRLITIQSMTHPDSETGFEVLHYHLGNLVGLNWDDSLVVTWKNRDGLHHNIVEESLSRNASIKKVTPFFVQIETYEESITYDFLNINQYLQPS